MKRTFVLAAMLLSSILCFGQETLTVNLKGEASMKIPNAPINKGESFTITSVRCDKSSAKGYDYLLNVTTESGKNVLIDLSKTRQLPVVFNPETKDEYWNSRSIQRSLPGLSTMVNAYALRNKAESSANDAVSSLRLHSMVIEDPYLTSYVNSLLTKISPAQRLDFFKYNFKVIVAKDDEPNAGIYPNGTLVINAGLLARLHTEDELVALLCHEANHFICNHYLDNMSKIQKRETAGIIGSAVLGVAAGVLTGSASLGMSTSHLSLGVASEINAAVTAMGLAFDQTQEKESDQAAVDLLPILGYDTNAMATCIKRIGDYYLEEGDLAAYYRSGNHPRIEDRIAATGIPFERRDSTFEKMMAPCVSYIAQVLYDKGRYTQAMELANRNISNNVGRGSDYLISGECLLAGYDTYETNSLACMMLQKAHSMSSSNLRILKSLIVANMRAGFREEARALLEKFSSMARDKEEEAAWAENMMLNI